MIPARRFERRAPPQESSTPSSQAEGREGRESASAGIWQSRDKQERARGEPRVWLYVWVLGQRAPFRGLPVVASCSCCFVQLSRNPTTSTHKLTAHHHLQLPMMRNSIHGRGITTDVQKKRTKAVNEGIDNSPDQRKNSGHLRRSRRPPDHELDFAVDF